MGFERGTWRCAVKRCDGKGEYSLIVHARTAGGRKERIQKASSAVRLCAGCTKDAYSGKPAPELLAAIKQAISRVRGER
jgi:hypothetical protein